MDPRCSLHRWLAKKAARHGMVALGGLRVGRRRPRMRVLTYHRFGSSVRDPFCVRREDFDRQMRHLADNRLAVSLEELEDFLSGADDSRPGGVLVTIDDGCRSTLTHALPILRQWGIPAVAYVVVGSLGRGRGVDRDQPEDYMSWRELEQLADAGVTIGSHAMHHRSLGRMGPAQARDEASRSKEILERRLGVPIRSFAYPFGTRADFGEHTRDALAAAGYTTGFTSQHGAVREEAHPLELPRIKVEGGEGPWMFERLCQGGMDAWGAVDRALWRLQRPLSLGGGLPPATRPSPVPPVLLHP